MSLDDDGQTIVCGHFDCEKELVLLQWYCHDHAHLTGLPAAPVPALQDEGLAELLYEMPQAERFRKLDELILNLIDHHEGSSERQLYRDLHNRIKQEESNRGP